jgi:hypothetical protein
MASRSGSAMATLVPRRNVRRDKCFLVMIMLCILSRSYTSRSYPSKSYTRV